MPEEDNCEFCGDLDITESTTFVGLYCEDCHRILIEQSREAIKEIKKAKAVAKQKRGRK